MSFQTLLSRNGLSLHAGRESTFGVKRPAGAGLRWAYSRLLILETVGQLLADCRLDSATMQKAASAVELPIHRAFNIGRHRANYRPCTPRPLRAPPAT